MRLILAGLAAVALAGCGQSATQKAAANQATALDKLAMEEAYGSMLKDAGTQKITVDLNRYGRSARAWAKDVGHDTAVRKLADDASGIQAVCGGCADGIDRIRATL